MKLGYYHYFFRERNKRRAPRVIHDIRPMLKAYLDHGDNEWKKEVKTDDGEHLLVLRTPNANVFMIVGTRKQDLIQAVNWKNMTCEDLTKRLAKDEDAGFAGFFTLSDRMVGMASSLRGPKTAAVGRLINHFTAQLGAARWIMELLPIGTSVSLEQAKELQYVTRTSIRVTPGTSFFDKFQQLGAGDEDSIASIEVIIRAKKNSNIQDTLEQVAKKLGDSPIDKMVVRAKAMLDDELADFYVASEGRLSEEIEPGTAQSVANSIANRFALHQLARQRLQEMMDEAVYAKLDVQDLTRLSDAAHWLAALQGH